MSDLKKKNTDLYTNLTLERTLIKKLLWICKNHNLSISISTIPSWRLD